MKKPIIGISCNYDYGDVFKSANDIAAISPKWHYICENYTRSIEEAGGIPLLLPVYRDEEDLTAALDMVDGVLISGGNDIDPILYGELDRGRCGRIIPERDRQDIAMARYVIEKTQKPMLCICRGIQVLNVAMHGSLYQDLESEGPFGGHMRKNYPMNAVTHRVSIAPDSLLFEILGKTHLGVNSFHHQSVKSVGSGLRVTAKSEDGVVEAVELEGGRFVLGLQWHPEKMYDSEEQKKIFAAFLERARQGGCGGL